MDGDKQPDDTKAVERWVYAGRRTGATGDVLHCYLPLNDKRQVPEYYADDDGLMLLFGVPLGCKIKRGVDSIGGVYEVTVDRSSGQAVAMGKAQYTKQLTDANVPGEPCHVRRARWEMEDRLAEADRQRRQREKAGKQDSGFGKLLQPVRDAYRATNYQGKRDLLALMLEFITR